MIPSFVFIVRPHNALDTDSVAIDHHLEDTDVVVAVDHYSPDIGHVVVAADLVDSRCYR